MEKKTLLPKVPLNRTLRCGACGAVREHDVHAMIAEGYFEELPHVSVNGYPRMVGDPYYMVISCTQCAATIQRCSPLDSDAYIIEWSEGESASLTRRNLPA